MNRKVFLLLAVITWGCSKQDLKEPLEYKGPEREVEDIEMYYTENDRIKVKMLADLVYEFANGNREFPEGLYMEFYNEFGHLESTLRANYAFYTKELNQWQGKGKVEVKNIEKDEQLNTEELFWKPAEKKIFTDKFVTIRQQGDVIYGIGLDAKQDLSDYTIHNPYGELDVKEEETQ
ncbi:MAG TPA: LPS export ABC transporter periplasmic protein LptC [Ohtaekwangia sp.]|nr:LPS export ABC transporter periplasmic protein LptC [Ohtaekwangia sp.]